MSQSAALGKPTIEQKETVTYGDGGFGSRSTFSIAKVYEFSFSQNFSGLSPGTLRSSSSSTSWLLPKKDSALDATHDDRSRAKIEAASLMSSNLKILLR